MGIILKTTDEELDSLPGTLAQSVHILIYVSLQITLRGKYQDDPIVTGERTALDEVTGWRLHS